MIRPVKLSLLMHSNTSNHQQWGSYIFHRKEIPCTPSSSVLASPSSNIDFFLYKRIAYKNGIPKGYTPIISKAYFSQNLWRSLSQSMVLSATKYLVSSSPYVLHWNVLKMAEEVDAKIRYVNVKNIATPEAATMSKI